MGERVFKAAVGISRSLIATETNRPTDTGIVWAADTIAALTADLATAEQERDALRQAIRRMADAGVAKLTELAPEGDWDSGETVAEMYLREVAEDTGARQ